MLPRAPEQSRQIAFRATVSSRGAFCTRIGMLAMAKIELLLSDLYYTYEPYAPTSYTSLRLPFYPSLRQHLCKLSDFTGWVCAVEM